MRSEEVCRMRRRFGLGFLIVALVVLFFVVAAVGMRLPHVLYARSHVISHFNSCRTEYGGLYTGLWTESLQSSVAADGETALAFLLNAAGFPSTTAEIRRESGGAGNPPWNSWSLPPACGDSRPSSWVSSRDTFGKIRWLQYCN